MPQTPSKRNFFSQLARSLGPAVIVACVVLGPGSILTSSRVGCEFDYRMQWIVIVAGVLMFGAVVTAARVGVLLEGSPCDELARRIGPQWGRPVAAVVGGSVFLIAACFQYSNNLGVLAGIEPLVPIGGIGRAAILVGLNTALIATLFGLRRLYAPLERLMAVLMGLMLLGFAANLLLSRPALLAIFSGWIPSLPDELGSNFLPRVAPSPETASPITRQLIDPWLAVQAVTVTTFSIAGAFYQAYLVREKGWGVQQLRTGLVDSLAGTLLLVSVSLMIMVTAATVLAGKVEPSEIQSAADVAQQLEPLFGSAAKWLFCIGILAGGISSFLVNSMVGGTLLADGLGLPAHLDGRWTKRFTVACLAVGMITALATNNSSRVPLIIFAQAMTVLGGPALALALCYLAAARTGDGRRVATWWMLALVLLGTIVVLAFALRTAMRLVLQWG